MINFTFFQELNGYVNLYPSTVTFNNIFDNTFLKDIRVQQIIKEIDKGEVREQLIYLPDKDTTIIPQQLSGGSKNLILPIIMEKEYPEQKYLISSRNLGNNCVNVLCKLSLTMDIGLSLVTALDITDNHYKKYDFYNIDYKEKINSYKKYAEVFYKFQKEYPNEMGAI